MSEADRARDGEECLVIYPDFSQPVCVCVCVCVGDNAGSLLASILFRIQIR